MHDEWFVFAACHASAASSKVGTVRGKACIQRFFMEVPANLASTGSAIQPLTRSKAKPIGPDGKAPTCWGSFRWGLHLASYPSYITEGV